MKRIILFILFMTIFTSAFADTAVVRSLKKYSSAIKLVNSGENNQAILLLKEVLNENPKLKYANVLLGICYYNIGNYSMAATNIGKFVEDLNNANDGSDKFPLALIYYLRCQHKVNNAKAVMNNYLLVDKYPIPNIAGQLFTAETLVDSSSNTTFPLELKKDLCDKGIEVLEKNKIEARNMIWFNNTYGRALIVEQSFDKDLNSQIQKLIDASKYFEAEIKVNNRSTVHLNLAVAYRLVADDYIKKFWQTFSNYKARGDLKNHYSELIALINEAKKYFQKSSEEIEVAKTANGFEQQKFRIKILENVTNREFDAIKNDNTIRKVLNH